MGITKQMNIKKRTYCFYNDLIDIKDFDLKLLKLDKKSYKNIDIYYIGFITKKDKYKINGVNPLYLLVHRIDGFIEKKGNKYFNIAFTDSNNDVLKKYAEVRNGVKDQIEKMNNGKLKYYEKDYMKIKFSSDDNLLLKKKLKFLSVTIIVRSVFKEDGKYYPQVFLDECLYEV